MSSSRQIVLPLCPNTGVKEMSNRHELRIIVVIYYNVLLRNNFKLIIYFPIFYLFIVILCCYTRYALDNLTILYTLLSHYNLLIFKYRKLIGTLSNLPLIVCVIGI